MAVGLSSLLFEKATRRQLMQLALAHRVQSGPQRQALFVPGTLASSLRDRETGQIVWGGPRGLSVNPNRPEGLRQLSLLDGDTVEPAEVMHRASGELLGCRMSAPVYGDALTALQAAGIDVRPCPYDWRRSVVCAARRVHAALHDQETSQETVPVGHSMGAIAVLWGLMYGTRSAEQVDITQPAPWDGAPHVSRAILLSPPLRGSAIALRNTVNGNRVAGPFAWRYPPAMLATHPPSFELMPPCELVHLRDDAGIDHPEILEPALWQEKGWGRPDDPQQAARISSAQRVRAILSRPIEPPDGLKITIVAGRDRRTPNALKIGRNGVKAIGHGDGDGTLLLQSAHPDTLRGVRGIHLKTAKADHARILSTPDVFAQVLSALSEP